MDALQPYLYLKSNTVNKIQSLKLNNINAY